MIISKMPENLGKVRRKYLKMVKNLENARQEHLGNQENPRKSRKARNVETLDYYMSDK